MRGIIKRLPYPVAGLMLALAALGNLLGPMAGDTVRYLCGGLATIILLLLIAKVIVNPTSVIKAFDMLPVASVMATLAMAVMLLSVYIKPLSNMVAMAIWFAGLALNIYVMIFFTVRHVLPGKLEKIFASYFVTYVGIVVASVTAKAYGMDWIGITAFAFGLGMYVALLPVVSYRYIKSPVKKEPLMPLVVIYGAPANLLVAGYFGLGLQWSVTLVITLWLVGVVTTFFAWYQMIRLRKLPFYPSYSAYTFPLVIGAIATVKFSKIVAVDWAISSLISNLGLVQTIICTAAVLYVFIQYMMNVVVVNEPSEVPEKSEAEA